MAMRSSSACRSVSPLATSPARTSRRRWGIAQRSRPPSSKNRLTVYSSPRRQLLDDPIVVAGKRRQVLGRGARAECRSSSSRTRGLTSTGQIQSCGRRGDLGHSSAARHRNAVPSQTEGRTELVPSQVHDRRLRHGHPGTGVAKATCMAAQRTASSGSMVGNHQVNALIGADADHDLDEFGIIAARHRQREIRDLACRRHRRVQIDRDHACVDAERCRASAKALDQLDPAAGRGDQDGARWTSPTLLP